MWWVTGATHPDLGGRVWQSISKFTSSGAFLEEWRPEAPVVASVDSQFPQFPDDRPLEQYRQTLALLEKTGARRALPAHGDPIEDVQGRARAILVHHRDRTGQVLELVGHRPVTAAWVSDQLFGELDEIFDWWLAVGETLAHLMDLVEDGSLRESVKDGIVHFSHL